MLQNFEKIFVGGSVMSGKNILWRLLDGHSNITTNIMHSNIGYALISDQCKDYFSRETPGISSSTYDYLPIFFMKYYNDKSLSIPIGDFFYALYRYSNYRQFYSWAKASSVFINMKEGENVRFPFSFFCGTNYFYFFI